MSGVAGRGAGDWQPRHSSNLRSNDLLTLGAPHRCGFVILVVVDYCNSERSSKERAQAFEACAIILFGFIGRRIFSRSVG